MIKTNDKAIKKEAPEVFKLIQMYMGDRKAKVIPDSDIHGNADRFRCIT